MILENILIMFTGTLLGIISGLVPGVGVVVSLLLCYPFIQHFDLLQSLMFYLAIVSASQYSGSVTATILGIPGEQSSFPAVIEGHALFKRGLGSYAISSAALGSTVGALVALMVSWLILPSAVDFIKSFYNNNVQLGILLVSSTFIIFAFNKHIQNFFLFVFGGLLASIGTSQVPLMVMWRGIVPYEHFPELYQGLPLFPVIVSLFVIPTLAANWNIQPPVSVGKLTYIGTFGMHIKEYLKHFKSSIRGSMLGAVAGLVPHLTTDLASNLSYSIEKKISERNGQYQHNGDIKSLVAAETANNSAGFMQLMPLLLIGVPITTSEALILSLLENNALLVNYTTTIESGMFVSLALWFIVINIVAFTFCWPLVRQLRHLYNIPPKHMFIAVMVILTAMIWYVGTLQYSAGYYLAVFALLAPVGYLLRNTNVIILIIAFVLQDKLLAAIIRASVIWTS